MHVHGSLDSDGARHSLQMQVVTLSPQSVIAARAAAAARTPPRGHLVVAVGGAMGGSYGPRSPSPPPRDLRFMPVDAIFTRPASRGGGRAGPSDGALRSDPECRLAAHDLHARGHLDWTQPRGASLPCRTRARACSARILTRTWKQARCGARVAPRAQSLLVCADLTHLWLVAVRVLDTLQHFRPGAYCAALRVCWGRAVMNPALMVAQDPAAACAVPLGQPGPSTMRRRPSRRLPCNSWGGRPGCATHFLSFLCCCCSQQQQLLTRRLRRAQLRPKSASPFTSNRSSGQSYTLSPVVVPGGGPAAPWRADAAAAPGPAVLTPPSGPVALGAAGTSRRRVSCALLNHSITV